MQTVERIETVVSLPRDLLEQANDINKNEQISDVIEMALREFVKRKTRAERDKRELELINANADKLNEEALDVLEYQQVNW
ncbi:MAG: type II toxin-antitoxin system CcdA family antitoxin [Pyrinomonadaceae bacterium]|nr:type II toxin-antitoxin system CcdA family antitoxin [Pyrinomonadaceae bacterium]